MWIFVFYLHIRRNSPYINHFFQPDTIIPDYTNPQSWNRYAYALNNPIRYNDPTGHWFDAVVDGAFIGYDIYDISQNGLNWENGLALTADVVCAFIPFVVGGGLAVRAIAHADDVSHAVKTAEIAADLAVDVATKEIDELYALAEKIAAAGDNADPDDIRKFLDSPLVTHNPDAKTVSLGSNGLYQKLGDEKGYTYFSTDQKVFTALGDNAKLVNDQFMADQALRGKNFIFTLDGPLRPTSAAADEKRFLDTLVTNGVYDKGAGLFYREALQIIR